MKLINKIKEFFGSKKDKDIDVLLEIAYNLETRFYDPNFTRFERYESAKKLWYRYYSSGWDKWPYGDFDKHIINFLKEFYGQTIIKPDPILLTAEQCRYAILISEYLMESLFSKMNWSRDDIEILSCRLAVNFEYDKTKSDPSLYDQIDNFMESTLALQIAMEHAEKRGLKLTDDLD